MNRQWEDTRKKGIYVNEKPQAMEKRTRKEGKVQKSESINGRFPPFPNAMLACKCFQSERKERKDQEQNDNRNHHHARAKKGPALLTVILPVTLFHPPPRSVYDPFHSSLYLIFAILFFATSILPPTLSTSSSSIRNMSSCSCSSSLICTPNSRIRLTALPRSCTSSSCSRMI